MGHFMFDTNIFNRILDGNIDSKSFTNKGNYFVTHIQKNELQNTKNINRRKLLLTTFESIPQQTMPTESTVFGVSVCGEAKLSSKDNLYEPIRKRLDELNRGKTNNSQDALVAESSIKNKFILVTEDDDLMTITEEIGGTVIGLYRFFELVNN